MTKATHEGPGTLTLAEMKEFAGFSAATQRYIRRSLDVAFDRKDAISLWSRDAVEVTSIDAQYLFYARLPDIKALVPDSAVLQDAEPFLAQLITVSAFDLGQGPIACFAAYRFLYERLLGADARPWLPAAFCAAASMPFFEQQPARWDIERQFGEVAEWLKAHAWKVCIRSNVSRVRIPLSPPNTQKAP